MIEEVFTFPSDGLALEACLSYTDDTVEPRAAALICPPHPFLGGDMDNNVISALARALGESGIPVLRFNYRGIGASECGRDLADDLAKFWQDSTCPEYEAEILIDGDSAYQHLEKILPGTLPFFVVGYSFGSMPAIRIAQSTRVDRLCLISPPVAKWTLPQIPTAPQCGLFYAPGDFACPEEKITALHGSLSKTTVLQAFTETDHFFVGREDDLATSVCEFLTS